MSGGGQNTVVNSSQPPPAFLDAYQKLVQSGQAQAQQPLQQYGGPMVAGFSPQQQQAFSTIQNAQGIAQPYINSGASLIGQSAAPISANGLITGDQLSGLAAAGQGYTNTAAGIGAGGAGIAGAAGNAANAAAGTDPSQVSHYFDPYLQSAVGATQAEFNNQNQQNAQGITSNAIKSGAFGGDRADVAQGIALGQEQLAQAPVIAGMENQGYQAAQQAMAQQDALKAGTALSAGNLGLSGAQLGANTGLSAAQQLYGLFGGQQQTGLAGQQASAWLGENAGAQLAGLGSAAENTALTGASANLQAGQQQQGLAQEQLNIPYEQFLARQAYPYQNLQFLAGLTTGAGSNAGGQSTSTSPGPSTLSQIGGAGLAGVGLLGATGAFGSGGYLSGLGSSIAGLFKRGGTVGYDAGGAIPDVSVSYVPGFQTKLGSGPPKAPNPIPEADPMQQGLASMKDASAFKGLFANGTDPALAGKLRGIGATWDAINASPETAGDFLASKFGGRAGYAMGGNPSDPYESNPLAQSSFQRFAGLPEEKLREMAVMLPPESSQGQMIRRALQQKQVVPANDNSLGLAATGTNGPTTGLAAGGVARMADGGAMSDLVAAELGGGGGLNGAFRPGLSGDLGNIGYLANRAGVLPGAPSTNAPSPMSFIPGARGVSIPQVGQSLFAQPQGLGGGGLPGWFNPLEQMGSSGATITTPMPKGIMDALNPPPPVTATASGNVSVSDPTTRDSGGSGGNGGGSGSDSDGGSSGGGGSTGSSSSASSSGTGPGSNSSHWGSTLGTGLGLAGMAAGVGGLGLAGNAIGTAADVSNMNKDMARIGAPAMGLSQGLSAFANNASFGMFGRSLDDSFANTNLSGTAATGGLNTADPTAANSGNAAGGMNGVGESAAGVDSGATDTADGGDRESGREGFGGNGHESDDSGHESAGGEGGGSDSARTGGRIGIGHRRTGLAEGGQDDDESLANAGPIPAGGIAATQPSVPDAHDAVDVKGLAAAGPPAPPDAGLAAAGWRPADAPQKAPEYTPGKPSPWMALLTAGAATMAGRSPFAGANLGAGLLAGTKEYERENELDSKPEVDHSGETVRIYYPSEKKWIDTGLPTSEAMRTKATSAEAKARLEQTGAYQTEALRLQDERLKQSATQQAATQAYQQGELGLRRAQLEQGKFTAQPAHDALGNVIGTNVVDNRTGTVKFEPTQGGAAPSAAGDLSKTGDDYLATLPSDKQAVVKSMVEGRMAPPTSFAMSKPYWQQMMQYANQVDPGFDQTTWPARVATRRDFAAGQSAKNVTALNTTLQHAEVLADTFDKMGNTGLPAVNWLKNWAATQAGSEAPTNASEAISAVASEARKVFSGSGGGGLTELDQWEKNFPLNGSPEQQKGAIKQLVNLMDSRLNALGDQYNRGMSKADDPVQLLSPEARKAYTKLTGRPPNETAIGGQQKTEAVPGALPGNAEDLSKLSDQDILKRLGIVK